MPTVRDDVLLDDRYVLVVDWIEGTSAAQLLAERGDPGLPVTTVLGWLPDIASALDHLHAQRPSVVHGDVRLGNIMSPTEDRAVLVFGAAALRNAAATSIADDVLLLASTVAWLLTGNEPKPDAPIVWDGVAPELAKRLDRVLRRALDPDAGATAGHGVGARRAAAGRAGDGAAHRCRHVRAHRHPGFHSPLGGASERDGGGDRASSRARGRDRGGARRSDAALAGRG